MKSFNSSMTTICLVIAMMTIQMYSSCDGAVMKSMKPTTDTKGKLKERQRHRRNMEKPTITPTSAPVTPSPTQFPTVSPTAEPTVYPTAYPTEKKSMQRSPQAVAAPTSFPVSVTVPEPTTSETTAPTTDVDDTDAPVAVITSPPSLPPSTISPTTFLPSTTPTVVPSGGPSALPSSAPSVAPSGSPIVSTNSPTAFPTAGPTYSNLTSQLDLSEFSILLLSFDTSSAVNVGLVESTLETYMNKSMLLENLVDVSLTPISASSALGSNFTATSIRFAGAASFIIEVPTQETLSLTQDGVILSSLSVPNIQKTFALNPSLSSIRVVNIGYEQFDPNSVVDVKPNTGTDVDVDTDVDGEKENNDLNSESGGESNSGLVIGLVLAFSLLFVGGALYMIRHRRSTDAKESGTTAAVTKTVGARKMGDSHYPLLRRHYPDIEKPKEESVNTPNDEEEDDESSAADLSSYMMTPTGSCATEIRGTTTVLKDSNKVEKTIIQAPANTQERPTVEISVSHIEAVADDEDYTSTDDGSARFGATDMSECTFRG